MPSVVGRRVFILLALLTGAIAGVVFALKSERVANNLKGHLEKLVQDRLGLALHIDKLELELLPPAISVEGVGLYQPHKSVPFLTLHRGTVSIHPWPSPAGALVVDLLELDGLRADVDIDALPQLLRPKRSAQGSVKMSLDVENLYLWNMDLTLRRGDNYVAVQRADVIMRPAEPGFRELSLSAPLSQLYWRGRQTRFETQLAGRLVGSLDRPDSITLERGQLFLKEIAVSATGALDLGGKPRASLQLSAHAPLARLHKLFPELPPADGALQLSAHLSGTPQAPKADVDIALTDLRYLGRDFGNVQASASCTPERIAVQSFRVSHKRAGELTGSGTVDLSRSLPLELNTRLHGVSLPGVLELAGLPDAWIRAKVSGDVVVKGKLLPLDLDTRTNAQVEGFTVLDRSYRSAGAKSFLSLPAAASLHAAASINTAGVNLTDVSITHGNSSVAVQGSMSFDPNVGMEMQVGGQRVDLGEMSPIAGVPFAGAGALAAAIEGPYADPIISGTVELNDFAVFNRQLGDIKATLIYSKLVFQIDRAQGKKGGGAYIAQGRFDFSGKEPRIFGAASLTDIELGNLLQSVDVPAEVAKRLRARISGDFSIDGPLLGPHGEGNLHAAKLQIDGTSLGELRFEGGFDDPTRKLWGKAETSSDNGNINAEVSYVPGGELTLAARLQKTSLAAIAPLLGGPDLAGTIDLRADLAGLPQALSGNVKAVVPELVAYGTHLGHTRLAGSVEQGTIEISGTLLDGAAAARGELHLTELLPYAITIDLDGTRGAVLWPSLAPLQIQGSGSVFSQGMLTRPSSILADIQLTSLSAAFRDLRVSGTRPVRLQYAEGRLHVVDLAVAGSGLRLSAAGKIEPDGSLALSLAGNGELDAVRRIFPKLVFVHGQFDGQASLAGTLDAPLWDGEAHVAGGVLRLPQLGQTLDALTGKISFAGRSLEISGSANTGGGLVRVSGQIAVPEDKEPQLNLRGELSHVSMHPNGETQLTMNGQLNLFGPADDLLLRGDVRLDSLRYSANFDLERLIPRKNAPPLRVAAIDPENAIRLAVRVAAPNNIVVTSNVMEAELQADLMVTGTTERMGLVGSVTPLWAHARYQDHLFDVDRASIFFTDEYRVFAEFDVRAHTEACAMDVVVEIHGDSNGETIVANGKDEDGPVPQLEVVSCLFTGVRRPGGPGTAGLSEALPAGGLDALWTVSGLDDEVRRVFPMVDELRLSSGWSSRSKRTTPRLVIGKELGKDLQLTYSRSLDTGDDQLVSVEYQLNKVATMQGTWNSASDMQVGDLGLDLRLRWEFQ